MSHAPSASPFPDRLTLIAISALAFLLETALHEHLGHAGSCVLLGSYPTALGAFYVDCDPAGLTDLTTRLVALAGPLVSLLAGIASFLFLRRLPPGKPALYYFVWLLGTIGFMSATGYLLFSGVSGIGDFGTASGGVFYDASPEWLWRVALTVVGIVSYFFAVRFAAREIAPHIQGVGRTRITYARHLVLVSYITGAVVAVAIGLLNPEGFVVVLISSIASSVGGTSGFLWMM